MGLCKGFTSVLPGRDMPDLLLAAIVTVAKFCITHAAVLIECAIARSPSNLHDALCVELNLLKVTNIYNYIWKVQHNAHVQTPLPILFSTHSRHTPLNSHPLISCKYW